MSPFRARPGNTAAFTLVELMVVLLVVGTLVALGLAKFAPATDAVKTTRAKAEVMNALKDASAYYAVNRSYAGIEDDVARNFSSVRGSVNASAGDCAREEMETAASEVTVDVCVDDQDLIIVSCDHAGDAWTVVSGDGSSSGPEKAAGACDGVPDYSDASILSVNFSSQTFATVVGAPGSFTALSYFDLVDAGDNHVYLAVSDCGSLSPCAVAASLPMDFLASFNSALLSDFTAVSLAAHDSQGYLIASTSTINYLPYADTATLDAVAGRLTINGGRLSQATYLQFPDGANANYFYRSLTSGGDCGGAVPCSDTSVISQTDAQIVIEDAALVGYSFGTTVVVHSPSASSAANIVVLP